MLHTQSTQLTRAWHHIRETACLHMELP